MSHVHFWFRGSLFLARERLDDASVACRALVCVFVWLVCFFVCRAFFVSGGA